MNVLDDILAELRQVREEVNALRSVVDAKAAATTHPDEPMDINGAAQLLKLAPSTIRKQCNKGLIPHYSQGKGAKLMFRRCDLLAHVERGKRQPISHAVKNAMAGRAR